MEFVVETAGVADGLPVLVPPPERGGRGLAVGAARSLPPGGGLGRGQSQSIYCCAMCLRL